MVKVGYACGTCPRCGRRICRPRPATVAVCDCWRYCPLENWTKLMEPYTPDLTPSQYDPDKGLDVIMIHISEQDHPQPYYSKQKPIEVHLT
ncbi:hypothetical protein DRO69_00970 [Candidatus Bathyarchaeota archaeon]|nr:MAG: hypothetical protein DRO69_00970 [Candidatus Bathyarchaeota archaeon]